jgi:hypothetical protein
MIEKARADVRRINSSSPSFLMEAGELEESQKR